MKKCFTLLALLGAAAAQAHVTLDQATATAGTYQKLAFRVGHGCDGKATTGLTVTLPDGATHAKPMPKPGWKISVTDNGALHEISWKDGSLPEGAYTKADLLVYLAESRKKCQATIMALTGEEAERRWAPT